MLSTQNSSKALFITHFPRCNDKMCSAVHALLGMRNWLPIWSHWSAYFIQYLFHLQIDHHHLKTLLDP